MTKKPLSGFELDFEIQRLKLGITKTHISKEMGVSLPTLDKKIKSKEKLTLHEVRKLENLGFQISINY